MPTVTNSKLKPDVASDVSVRFDESIVQTEAERLARVKALELLLKVRKRTMPKLLESKYRENAGRPSLDVSYIDGSWDDLIEFAMANPRQWIEVETAEFVGVDDNGNESTPSVGTIVKNLKIESYRRGRPLGFQFPKVEDADGNEKNSTTEFRFCYRSGVTKTPSYFKKMREAGHRQDLMSADAEQDTSEEE